MNTTLAKKLRNQDPDLDVVCKWVESIDKKEWSKLFRKSYDQIYDGVNTGRYKWKDLCKTEKTHFGTIIEINIQKTFAIDDGNLLDYLIKNIEVDCKFSQKMYSWMIPHEAYGQICLLCHAIDDGDINSNWSIGVMRTHESDLGDSRNQDKKGTLSKLSQDKVYWVYYQNELPKNVLLCLPQEDQDAIFESIDIPRKGQFRINELFRKSLGRKIGRSVILTVGKQEDALKRVRGNGGARSHLRKENIIILSGKWESHKVIAKGLDLPDLEVYEFIAVRVIPCSPSTINCAKIGEYYWEVNLNKKSDKIAPILPER